MNVCMQTGTQTDAPASWTDLLSVIRKAAASAELGRSDMTMSRKSMIKPYKHCKKCGARMDATDTNVGGKGGADNG